MKIRYKKHGAFCMDQCPAFINRMIGSTSCANCRFCVSHSFKDIVIECNAVETITEGFKTITEVE